MKNTVKSTNSGDKEGASRSRASLSGIFARMAMAAAIVFMVATILIAYNLVRIGDLADESHTRTIPHALDRHVRSSGLERLARSGDRIINTRNAEDRAAALDWSRDSAARLIGASEGEERASVERALALIEKIAAQGDRRDSLEAEIRDAFQLADELIDEADTTLAFTITEAGMNLKRAIANIGTATNRRLVEENVTKISSENTSSHVLLTTLRDMRAALGGAGVAETAQAIDRRAMRFDALGRRLDPLLDRLPTGGDVEYLPEVTEKFMTLSAVFAKQHALLKTRATVTALKSEAEHLLAGLTEAFSADVMKSMEQAVKGSTAIASRTSYIQAIGVVVLVMVIVVGGYISLTLRRHILIPIIEASRALNALRKGALNVAMAPTRTREFEAVRISLESFRRAISDRARLEKEQEAERAARERRAKQIEAHIAEFDGGMTTVLGEVTVAAGGLEDTAKSMAATAEQTRQQATEAAQASGRATESVRTVAEAAQTLSGSISEIVHLMAETSKTAQRAADETTQTNQAMEGLVGAASRIGEVVDLINAIAGQTNLLALNATIEAARAGEAGKGFAVVAQEVKNLANQTARATEEISAQIEAIQSETGAAAAAIGRIGETISEINATATTVAASMEQQGTATREIALNVKDASAGAHTASTNSAAVAAAAGHSGGAAADVLRSAGDFIERSATLKMQIDMFLEKVRAA